MRTVQRNKRDVWYALYLGEQDAIDADGNYTGETEVVYDKPVKIRANVSPATGQANIEMFGNFTDYDRVVVTDQVNIPVNETASCGLIPLPWRGRALPGLTTLCGVWRGVLTALHLPCAMWMSRSITRRLRVPKGAMRGAD